MSAVESLSDDVLLRLDKGHTRNDIEEALGALDDVGVPMRPSLLPFSPWENLDGYRDLLLWVAEADLYDNIDPVMMAIRLLIPPGSAILDDPDRSGWLGDLDAEAFTYRWVHPDPRMDQLFRVVSAIVEDATRSMASNRETFTRIWHAAFAVDGDRESPPLPEPKTIRPKPPRLTESWFC